MPQFPLGGKSPRGLLTGASQIDTQAIVGSQVHDLVPRTHQRLAGGGPAATPTPARLEHQDRQGWNSEEEDSARACGDETPGKAHLGRLEGVGVLVSCGRRHLSRGLGRLRRLQDLRAWDGTRLGHLSLRHMIARRSRVEHAPDTARELDLNPRANIGSTQGRGTSLGAALGVGSHDDARVDAQLVQHKSHESRVLLIVANQVLVGGQHALQPIAAHARPRKTSVLVEVIAVGGQVVFDGSRRRERRRRVLRELGGPISEAVGNILVLQGYRHRHEVSQFFVTHRRDEIRGHVVAHRTDGAGGQSRIRPRINMEALLLLGCLPASERDLRGSSKDGNPRA